MIPLWAWNEDLKKWEVFPAHLVETLSDGSLGFCFHTWRDCYSRVDAFKHFRKHFEWNPINQIAGPFEYRLRKQR